MPLSRFLSWFKKRPPPKDAAAAQVLRVRFLCEQDGPIERVIKGRWSPIFAANPEVRRAFLVRAAYETETDQHVILAICSSSGPDPRLLKSLQEPYQAIFHRDCPLDMVFVTTAQEAQIENVCPAFYTAA
jgi:type III secretion system (T3SS) SseB-like protein